LNGKYSNPLDYEVARTRMVKEQVLKRGITDKIVQKTMLKVPRHLFVDQAFWPRAYSDNALPIGHDQTISQPYIVALMTQEMALTGKEKVLEIGTGSGYQAAVLADIGCTVYTIERVADLSGHAKEVIRTLGLRNIYFRVGDGPLGWKEKAPFDRIIVTAGAPAFPEVLMEQLSPNGRILIPVGKKPVETKEGEPPPQQLLIITRQDNTIEKRYVAGCNFVPLIGKHGWGND
jgi:protein-L-isoaspartate(D-aspartate) O-methyltransferase